MLINSLQLDDCATRDATLLSPNCGSVVKQLGCIYVRNTGIITIADSLHGVNNKLVAISKTGVFVT